MPTVLVECHADFGSEVKEPISLFGKKLFWCGSAYSGAVKSKDVEIIKGVYCSVGDSDEWGILIKKGTTFRVHNVEKKEAFLREIFKKYCTAINEDTGKPLLAPIQITFNTIKEKIAETT